MIRSKEGFFGPYGGAFIPEILMPPVKELQEMFVLLQNDQDFYNEYISLLKDFSGRPTPLTYAENLTKHFGKGKIYIKREDLNHSGAHKINNVMGQGLMMKRLGKKRVIAETGAGQHGIATAIMAAKMGYEATIYMGAEDVKRQYPNVFWMKQLGATVIPVTDGTATLKDAINAAMRDWATNFDTTHYCLGTACGPYPFPELVTFFQRIIGLEAKEQMMEKEGQLPTKIYACVGGGSNAMGIFEPFIDTGRVDLIGVEAGGTGKHHASRIASEEGVLGVAQGYKTLFLQDENGQMEDTYSIAAGLDYTGVSPLLAYLNDIGCVQMIQAEDDKVIEAFKLVLQKEGIIPALESSHAFAGLFSQIDKLNDDDLVVVNLSGRGDKDIFNMGEALEDDLFKAYVKDKGDSYVK